MLNPQTAETQKDVVAQPPTKSTRFRKKTIMVLAGGGLFLLLTLILTVLLFSTQIQQFRQRRASQEAWRQKQLSQQRAQETVHAVEALMELPDEEPTVATISDLSKLQGQPFFFKAEEGDQVLFFAQAQKAVLYRPTANKIIEVAALELQN